jgi:hypothetical protein
MGLQVVEPWRNHQLYIQTVGTKAAEADDQEGFMIVDGLRSFIQERMIATQPACCCY